MASQVTPASADPRDSALQLALTFDGLEALGLQEETLAQFPHELREGMTTPHRQRVLGDLDGDAPEGWRWGGPANSRVDAVLMLYTDNEDRMTEFAASQTAALDGAGIQVIASLNATDLGDLEPFGFRDGISQPVPEGIGRETRAEDTVKPGEFVLGYPNEYGLLTDRPLVAPGAARATWTGTCACACSRTSRTRAWTGATAAGW